MPVKRLRRDEIANPFVDLEAEEDDASVEDEDEAEEEEYGFIDNTEFSDSTSLRSSSLPPDSRLTPAPRIRPEIDAVASVIERRYGTKSRFTGDANLGTEEHTWMFRYPYGQVWTMQVQLDHPTMKPFIPEYFQLPILPRTFFVRVTSEGLWKLRKAFSSFPITDLTPIPRELYEDYQAKANERKTYDFEDSALVRVKSGIHRGDLARVIGPGRTQGHAPMQSSSHLARVLRLDPTARPANNNETFEKTQYEQILRGKPDSHKNEDQVLIVLVPRIGGSHGQKRTRGGQRMRPPQKLFDIKAALDAGLLTEDTERGGYVFGKGVNKITFTEEGLRVLKIESRELELVQFPELTCLLPLITFGFETQVHREVELALKGRWKPNVKVMATVGAFEGFTGRVISHCDTERATIDVLFDGLDDPVEVPVGELRLRLEIGDGVLIAWGPDAGKSGIVGKVDSSTASIHLNGAATVESPIYCLQPTTGDLVDEIPPGRKVSPHVSATAYVVRGPYRGCVGTVLAVEEEPTRDTRPEPKIYQGYVNVPQTINPAIALQNPTPEPLAPPRTIRKDLICKIHAVNHQPEVVQVKQKDVLLFGFNHTAMSGEPLEKYYGCVKFMKNGQCVREDLLWDENEDYDEDLFKRYPLTLLEVPAMFATDVECVGSSSARGLVGENCFIVSGERKGYLSRIRGYGHDSVTVEGAGVDGNVWTLKKSQVVALDRSVVQTMDGTRLKKPLNRTKILNEKAQRASTPPPETPPCPQPQEARPPVPDTAIAFVVDDFPELTESPGAFLIDHSLFREAEEAGLHARVRINSHPDKVGDCSLSRCSDPTKGFAGYSMVWVTITKSGRKQTEAHNYKDLRPATPKKRGEKVLVLRGEFRGYVGVTTKVAKTSYLATIEVGGVIQTYPWRELCLLAE